MMKNNIIAIDGPSGAGKSTVSKRIANNLGLLYIDTGAMYRAITYKFLKNKIKISSTQNYSDVLKNTKIFFIKNKICIDGKILNEEIRTKEINENVSIVASNKYVRDFLSKKQLEIGNEQPSIIDGRDIGTVLFPNAILKIFLTADVNARAKRRYKQNISRKISNETEEDIKKSIKERDTIDINREHAPLKKAEDAIEVDSSNLTIEEVIEKIQNIYRERIEKYV